MKWTLVGWAALLAVAVYMLMEVRYRVEFTEEEIADIRQQVEREQDTVRVLRTEWAYLTRPERLQKLAESILYMEPMTDDDLFNLADLPEWTNQSDAVFATPPIVKHKPIQPVRYKAGSGSASELDRMLDIWLTE